jgi:hypothetical protein
MPSKMYNIEHNPEFIDGLILLGAGGKRGFEGTKVEKSKLKSE